jgi:hypothetical protein
MLKTSEKWFLEEYLVPSIPYLKKWYKSSLCKIISVKENEVKSEESEKTVEIESWEAADRHSVSESVTWEAATRPSITATTVTNYEQKEMSLSPVSVFDSDEEGQISLRNLTFDLPGPEISKELTPKEKKTNLP